MRSSISPNGTAPFSNTSTASRVSTASRTLSSFIELRTFVFNPRHAKRRAITVTVGVYKAQGVVARRYVREGGFKPANFEKIDSAMALETRIANTLCHATQA